MDMDVIEQCLLDTLNFHAYAEDWGQCPQLKWCLCRRREGAGQRMCLTRETFEHGCDIPVSRPFLLYR